MMASTGTCLEKLLEEFPITGRQAFQNYQSVS